MVDHETLDLFDELYYSSYDDVLKYVIIHCSSAEDAKDIVQNVYLEVLKKLKNGETKIERSYIFGIAKNKVKDHYRFSFKHKVNSLFSKIKGRQEEINLTIR